MPSVSEFFGIQIYVYWRDHAPPHFHAFYGSDEAAIGIEDLELIRGHLPRRALRLVMGWASLHQDELREVWLRAQMRRPLGRIEPLE